MNQDGRGTEQPAKAIRWARATVGLGCAALAFLFYFHLFLPFVGQAGLQVFAAVEPHARYVYSFRVPQLVWIMGARYLLAPFALYLGFRITWRIAKRSWPALAGPPRPRSRARKALGILWRLYYYPVGFVVAAASAVLLAYAAKGLSGPGFAAFVRNCGSCHNLQRTLNFSHPPAVWEEILIRMAMFSARDGKPMSEQDLRDIHAFLVRVRSQDAEGLVRAKCRRCHALGRVYGAAFTAEEWRLLVHRVWKKNPFFISTVEERTILDHLLNTKGLARPEPTTEPTTTEYRRRLLFEVKCAQCHTLDIVLLPPATGNDWRAILKRMAFKNPGVLSEEEALSLLPLIEKERADPAGFPVRYPHSQKDEQE